MDRAIKTSVSLRRKTLSKIKSEARRQRRSISSLVNIWVEDALNETDRHKRKDGVKAR